MKFAVLPAVALLTLAAPAFAADLAFQPAAPVYLPFSWTGFYVGAQGGYQWAEVSGVESALAGVFPAPYSFNVDGGLIGGHIGYNYQTGNVVLGVEGDANYAIDAKAIDRNVLDSGATLFDITGQQKWTANIRGRLGYAFDRFLPYIAGGVAFGDVTTTYALAGGPPYLSKTSDRVGWTIGAGLEYAITDNILARVEYRYTDLGSKNFSSASTTTEDRVKFHSNAVLAGISYKF
jgi:outer membrane immunogenic protein